jgi:hypothetical protein
MLAWYLRLGGADMRSTCDEEAAIGREIMSGWQGQGVPMGSRDALCFRAVIDSRPEEGERAVCVGCVGQRSCFLKGAWQHI